MNGLFARVFVYLSYINVFACWNRNIVKSIGIPVTTNYIYLRVKILIEISTFEFNILDRKLQAIAVLLLSLSVRFEIINCSNRVLEITLSF